MRCVSKLASAITRTILACVLGALILAPSTPAKAADADRSLKLTVQRQHAKLGEAFETATLRALHFTLSEVGDGGAFVWHHKSGRLKGVFKPTSSFQDADGKVCRHIVIILSASSHAGKTEGIACRQKSGRWVLES